MGELQLIDVLLFAVLKVAV